MLFTRLLPFFCLLLLSAVSVGQDYRRIPVVPSSCPVTKPDTILGRSRGSTQKPSRLFQMNPASETLHNSLQRLPREES